MQLLKLSRYLSFGAVVVVYCLSFGLQAAQVFNYKAVELIDEKEFGDSELNILLSSPKRISNALVIDSQRLVQGKVSTQLYKIRPEGNLRDAYKSYEDRLASAGKIEYQCEKRACGSSNYWANKIFNEHRLYGRDSDQYYIAGQFTRQGKQVWQTIYFVMNGLKQSLVYVVSVEHNKPGEELDASLVWSKGVLIENEGVSEQTLKSLNQYIETRKSQVIYLISYTDNDEVPNDVSWRLLEEKSTALTRYIHSLIPDWRGAIQRKLIGPMHSEKAPAGQEVWHRIYVY